MLQKKFKTLSAASLFGLLCIAGLFFLTSCGHGVKVDVCVSDPANAGFQCVDKQGKGYYLDYGRSENYIALSPDDAEAVFNALKACRAKGNK